MSKEASSMKVSSHPIMNEVIRFNMILWIIKTFCTDFSQQRFVCTCVVVYVFTCFDKCGGAAATGI